MMTFLKNYLNYLPILILLQKTLNPIFDECFEFGMIMQEQCIQENAMIVFTVMDHVINLIKKKYFVNYKCFSRM
jgi:hypothetical protein